MGSAVKCSPLSSALASSSPSGPRDDPFSSQHVPRGEGWGQRRGLRLAAFQAPAQPLADYLMSERGDGVNEGVHPELWCRVACVSPGPEASCPKGTLSVGGWNRPGPSSGPSSRLPWRLRPSSPVSAGLRCGLVEESNGRWPGQSLPASSGDWGTLWGRPQPHGKQERRPRRGSRAGPGALGRPSPPSLTHLAGFQRCRN